MKQRCMIPAEKHQVWLGAVEKDVLLILYVISIAQVTNRGGIVSPSHLQLVGLGCGREV